MARLISWVLRHRAMVSIGWVALIGVSGMGAVRLPGVLTGASDGVPGSRSVATIERAVTSGIPAGTFFPFLVLLTSDHVDVRDGRFQAAAREIEERLHTVSGGGAVRSYWNTGRFDLLGRNRRTALILFRSNVESLNKAEVLTRNIRSAVRQVRLPDDLRALVTGVAPMYFDLNQQSSMDLLQAERVGVPITLVILLATFGSPMAAGLPVLLALSVVMVSAAALFLLSGVTSVSVFSQNVVSMIGLGVGVDYALFIVGGFRAALAEGRGVRESAARCV